MVYSSQSVFPEQKHIEMLVAQSHKIEVMRLPKPTLLQTETSKTPVNLYELKRSFSASSLLP